MEMQTLITFSRPSHVFRAFAVSLTATLIASAVSTPSLASEPIVQSMDTDTHSVVIEKLEMSLKKAKDDETISLSPVRARLADLYSDRARLREIDENKHGAKPTGSKSDRARALELYAQVLAEADKAERGPIMIHMSHLHLLIAQPAKAEAIYETIIKEGSTQHAPEILQQAYAGRAEHRYQAGDFKNSRGDFEIALRLAPPTKRGPLAHRVAWCNLNLDDQPTAVAQLVDILSNPEMMKRESTSGASMDLSFQDEVATDLATFVARGRVTSRQIQMVEDLTPERSKLPVMRHLAEETERLGQAKAALEVWGFVSHHEPKGVEKMEVASHVARLQYNLADKPAALSAIQSVMTQWKRESCNEKLECENLRKEIRNLITDWTKAETKHPSETLLAVYQSYVAVFNGDVEMMYFAAETAKAVKHYSEAVALYHKTSTLAVSKKDEKSQQILESSLTNEVEMAELAPKETGFALRQAAYDFYLRLSPKGKLNHQVRYQRARLPYEQGKNQEASQRLEEFARSTGCQSTEPSAHQLCIQAADLDLDARVQMKNDVAVEKGALLYSKLFGEKKLEYLKIARTSAMKQAQVMEPKAAISKLATIDTTGMDRDERLRLLKTRMSLSEKTHDLPALKVAATQLLETPKIDAKDHEYALSRLAYVAEMSFDFSNAYSLSSKMEMKELNPADRELKLAMFAELAGKDPRKHEEAFLQLSKNASKRAVVRAKLVREAKNKARELARQEPELSRFPSIYAPLVLEIYAETGDRGFAERKLRSKIVANQPAGKALARQLFLADFAKIEQQLATHKMRAKSERLMQRSLADRIYLLNRTENMAAKAIKMQDWTAQAVTLAVLSRENARMYTDVLSLPVPRGLRGPQRLQYQKAVEANANVYQQKHLAIEQKLQAFWGDAKAFDSMVSDFSTAKPELRRLMAHEIRTLAHVAPAERQQTLAKALSEGVDHAAPAEIAVAVRQARQSPFNTAGLSKLRELEESRGRDTMVAYLDARMSKLKEEPK